MSSGTNTTGSTAAAAYVHTWARSLFSGTSLDFAGLVALADLETIARRTAITGSASYFDVFLLCPGIHRQQYATGLNGGELPASAALTTGYAFRVENQATVAYLQKMGRTGHLVTLEVTQTNLHKLALWKRLSGYMGASNATGVSVALYLTTLCLTLLALAALIVARDYWGLSILLMLIFARFCNVCVIRRRYVPGWKGFPEPGVMGDTLVLLSQDRWIRLKGLVDDLKAVTSGQWLRDMEFLESSVVAAATLVVYLAAALASNASQLGKLISLALLLVSVGLLAIGNEVMDELQMHGRTIRRVGTPKKYARRLDLANELIKQSGRRDWAFRLGMIVGEEKTEQKVETNNKKDDESGALGSQSKVTM